MSNKNIIRAWKDPAYCNSLSEAEQAALPPNPAGSIEISEADLGKVAGAALKCSVPICTTGQCSHMACGYSIWCP